VYIADTYNHRIRRMGTDGTITTVAGTGTDGFSGDGGPAAGGRLAFPFGVAVDGAGNVYIADTDNHRIRRVDADGTITTVVGTGTYGYGGDGGPATAAQLAYPFGVAVDGAGVLYIADFDNFRIRKVGTDGVITTVAGNGTNGFGGDGGPGTTAQIAAPHGLAVDEGGNVYIADRSNNRIRKLDAAGIITTVAGTGTAGFAGDGGPATAARLASPQGVAVDDAGNLYITDRDNARIRRVDAGGTITTIAGTGIPGYGGDGGLAVAAQLKAPFGAAVDAAGTVFVADTDNHRVRRIAADGTITTAAGTGFRGFTGEGGPATVAQLLGPRTSS